MSKHLILIAVILLAAARPASAAWNQPVGGPSPINQAGDQHAQEPSLATVGGVPHVAWTEFDGSNYEVRVSRLNSAGGAWEQVVGGPSPINHDPTRDAISPSLAAVGGIAYVAWSEDDGTNGEIRVSRLNNSGTAWEELVGGVSPINQSNSRSARTPSLAAIGGIPYVAWSEDDGANAEIRVSRLNPSGPEWVQVVPGASPVNNAGNRDAASPSLASVRGVPHVAWTEYDGTNEELRVSALNGTRTSWIQVVGGPSPINHATDRRADRPSLAEIDGVPHVAWTENDGVNTEIRVSRPNGAETAWEEVVGGPSPINQASGRSGADPSLIGIDGAPYVAWREQDEFNWEVRVSRLNSAARRWEQVVGGPSPINHSSVRGGFSPSLASVGGVPYVAWSEADGPDGELRVSRLEPEFLAHSALTTDTEALLLSRVRSYGVSYPIAFQYGLGAALDNRSSTAHTAYGDHEDTAFQSVGPLTPGAGHSWRALGFDGIRATGVGPTQTLTTRPQNGPGPPGPEGGQGPPGEPASRLLLALTRPRLEAGAGRKVKVEYLITGEAGVTLEVRRGRKLVATVAERAGHVRTGRNRITWKGRINGKKARPGRYTLVVTATGSDGQTASDTGKLRVKR